MLRNVDYGYADANENLANKPNIDAWMVARASKTDYKANNGYGAFESSNGEKVGIFESAQSGTSFITKYNDRQFVDMQSPIDKLDWLISQHVFFRSDATLTMFASEKILKKDWDTPEEDAAWANL